MTSHNNHSFSLVGKLALFMLLAGGVTAWLTLKGVNNITPTVRETPETVTTTPSTPPTPLTTQATGEVYWVKVTDTKTELVPTTVHFNQSATEADPNNQVQASLTQLLAGGHNDSSNSTLIPDGTKLLDYQVAKDGIHINLSKEFIAGHGSIPMMVRLGQVIYTATAKDNQAKVWLSVEGKPLEVLGEGEGLTVEQPMTREKFKQDYQL